MRIRFDREPLRIGLHDGHGVTVCGFPLNVCSHLDVPCRIPYDIHYAGSKIMVTSNPYHLHNIFMASDIL